MESLSLEEENIIKDIRNLFRLKKEIKGIKDIIPRNIKNVFEYQKKEVNYYKPVRLNTFWSSNIKVKHINVEYKSNDDRNKTLSVEEYLDKIRPYLKDIINDLKKSGIWKIQLTIAITFISSRDDNNEGRVMHSNSNNLEIIISDEVGEVIEELFNSLQNRYQNNSQLVRGSHFVFDYVQLLYCKCHRINFKCGLSCIDPSHWIKTKKATTKSHQ